MTYKQIFREIYAENKWFIRIYLGISLCISIFLFYAGGTSFIAGAAALTEEETNLLGGSFTTLLYLFSNNANVPLSPPIALSCSAIMSIWGEYGTLPAQMQNFSFGFMDMWPMRIFAFAWAVISVLPRCTQFTRIGGLVIEDIDHKIGRVASLFVAASQTMAMFNGGSVALASTSTSSATAQGGYTALNIILCFLFLVGLLVCFMFIRTFLFFIDIIQLPLCTLIPGVSALSEICKVAGVVLMFALPIMAPTVYIICYLVLLVISMICFKKAYIAVRYFKSIYARPFFKKIFGGFDTNIALINSKAPKRILQETEGTELRLLIPVYSLRKTNLSLYIMRHDRWWLAVNTEGACLYKYFFYQKRLQKISLSMEETNKIFIKNSLRFFEIFSLTNEADAGKNFRKAKKKWHFVYSNEYAHRFNDISEITGFIDYNQYMAAQKVDKPVKKSFFRKEKQTAMK